MNASQMPSAPVPQRWERPLNVPPGFWKKQLPTKYLKLAAQGNITAIRPLLLEHPDFLNKRGSHNRTLLWEATRRGQLATVRWLIEQGAELDAVGSYNSESHVQITPYCASIYYHRPDVATYLSSLNPQLDIFRSAFLGEQQRVAEMLADESFLLDAEDPLDPIYYMPLIAFPVANGQAAMVEFLLHQGAVISRYSAGLLGLVARLSRMDLIEMLIAYGADARSVDSAIFASTDDLQIIRYLLHQGASASQYGKNRFPPLIYLARGDKGEHPEKVRMILEQGADVNAFGPKGRTALHYAAVAGYVRVITVLLTYGADATLKDEQGETALSLAQAANKPDVVSLLSE